MSVTRLVVLGATRFLQPAHGYSVLRELQSWHVEEWAHLNPGSIYNALRSLTKAGFLSEEPAEPVPGARGPGSKSAYRVTPDGETEFITLVRDALWQLHPYQPEYLTAGIGFWGVLTREEVIDALDARRAQLLARLSGSKYAERTLDAAPFTPAHVVEQFRVHAAHQRGELEWVDEVAQRVKDGAYSFAGEPDAPT